MATGTIVDRFRANENLPSLPGVAIEVLALTEQPDCTIEQLAGVIQNDPAITARILKIINSPLFGVAKNITSIKQASTLLGLRKLRIMALSFSIVQAIRPADGESVFDYETYWQQALTSAVAGRLLATHTYRQMAEEAFVAGLLHNIGLVAGYLTAPDLFAPLLKRAGNNRRWSVDDEIELLGASHAELSAELLGIWGLPTALTQVVQEYRQATPASSVPPLNRLLRAGVHVADLFGSEADLGEIDQCRTACMALTGIRSESLEQVLDSVATRVQEIAHMMMVPIGQTNSYEQIVARAKEQLSQTISSDHDEPAHSKEKPRDHAA